MRTTTSLELLFNPRALALVGATGDRRKSGGNFLHSLLKLYRGRLYAVNPNMEEAMGLRCYPSARDLPDAIDLAIIATPARVVPAVLDDCVAKGVPFAVIHGAGFKEVGSDGAILEREVVARARAGGMRLVGPNCMGIFSPEAGIDTVTYGRDLEREPGPVSAFGQSGWLCGALLVNGTERGIRFRRVVSSGNQADLGTVDYLRDFAADPETGIVAGYVEGLSDGRAFLDAAIAAARRKPVVLWKAGGTGSGARAALSHTGSLASDERVAETALRQAGVTGVSALEELLDRIVAFSAPCLPAGPRVGVIVDAGGGAVTAGDACERAGLQVPALPEETQDQLHRLLAGVVPPFSGISNPVDLVWPPDSEEARLLLGAMELMSPLVDSFLFVLYTSLSDPKFAEALRLAGEHVGKPVFVVPALHSRERPGMALYTQKRIPTFPTVERAAWSLGALVEYARFVREGEG